MLPDSAAEERARIRFRRFNGFDLADVVVNGLEEGLVSGTRDWTDETHAYATTRPRVRRLEDDAGIFRRSSYRGFKVNITIYVMSVAMHVLGEAVITR